jgi:hypothetical protein
VLQLLAAVGGQANQSHPEAQLTLQQYETIMENLRTLDFIQDYPNTIADASIALSRNQGHLPSPQRRTALAELANLNQAIRVHPAIVGRILDAADEIDPQPR